MLAGVLTGDLIASSQAKPEQVEYTMARPSGDLPSGIGWGWTAADLRFTRFRGDGWQMLIPDGTHALRWAIVLLAMLRADPKALESRISIGIGPVDRIGSIDLRDASGPTFEASGRGLDAMHRDERLFIKGAETEPAAKEQSHFANPVLPAEVAATIVIDERISRWTAEQAEATAHFLHLDRPQASEIAARLGITPQAIGYRLKGAGAKPLREALEAMEASWSGRWSHKE